LIVCPASLVIQWQSRLGEMFDIRLAQYVPQADTPRAGFWNTHTQVVASLQTLRIDHQGRHSRLLDAEPWDLLMVDEAHHLNADEESGPTLGYRLVQKLVEEKKVSSVVFFTGTPHRGKAFGFLSLLKLLRPDLFNPRLPMQQQLPSLRHAMIRNNKQNVTDLQGKRLFHPPLVSSETYSYSCSESRFYDMLTEFISTGRAYASSLGVADARLVTLVLIAMQKLASSSVAAIRRALRNRLNRIEAQRKRLRDLNERITDAKSEPDIAVRYSHLEADSDTDDLAELEEELVALQASIRLMENEEPELRQLIAAADEVTDETKISKILSVLDTKYEGRLVLFFTEYKATQSLLMSALIRRFGDTSVAFINGDDRAEDVVGADGVSRSLHEDRETAADRFNSSRARFLVSTEAGGEGIDLQEACYSMFHVDLPWNPMRLHQRVGRLNRYGQTRQVEVVTVRNPDTVESRIWDKLNSKIESIMLALSQVVEEPEDLLELVLGMTSPSLYRGLFSEAPDAPEETLSKWFDTRAASFGGKDVVETVSELVGHSDRFDFQQVSRKIPPLDLPALRPFVETMLAINHRRIRRDGDRISFKTPDAWLVEQAVRTSYDGLHFDRSVRGRDAIKSVLGVGHKVVNRAIKQAVSQPQSVCSIANGLLEHPLVIARITDRVTGKVVTKSAVVVGAIQSEASDGGWRLLRDWEVVEQLNCIATQGLTDLETSPKAAEDDCVTLAMDNALRFLESQIASLELSFEIPEAEVLTVLWPTAILDDGPESSDDGDKESNG
jgi:superfamily II DNA or RNA helicase